MVRTSEQLKELFKQNKEKKEKQLQLERENKKRLRQEKYKELCHQADELLKKAQEDAKRKKMEELQALAKKTPQNQNKHPLSPPRIYNSKLHERDTAEHDLFTTREELQQWEEENWKCIDWNVWDRVVKETRKEIQEALKDYKAPLKERWDNRKYTVYVYDSKLEFIGEYPSTYKCARALGINSRTVGYWIEQGRPHKKLGITFLRHKLTS